MSIEVATTFPRIIRSRLSHWSAVLVGQRWAPPLALLAVCLAGYGLLAPTLGFYWDDWPVLPLVNQQDTRQFLEYFTFDRPISAWTFLVSAPLLGTHPVAWQFFTILAHWLAGVGLWSLILGVWPDRRREALLAGALFTVYPSFLQQSVSVAYSQHFLCYALFTGSLAAMVWAVRRPRWYLPLMAFAVLADALQLFSMEYFAGLELLRPAFLWLLFQNRYPKRGEALRMTMRHWLSFALILGAFAVWRFGLYGVVIGSEDGNATRWIERLRAQPLTALIDMAQMAIQDTVHILVRAWNTTLLPEAIVLREKTILISTLVGAAVALSSAWFALRIEPGTPGEVPGGNCAYVEALVFGLAAILLGGLPVWLTDRQAILGTWSDRFTLAPIFGACLVLIGAAGLLFQTSFHRILPLVVLLGLGVSLQIRTTNEYRLNWDIQKEFYWQLSWRAPGLRAGTALLGTQMPFTLVGDYSVAAAVNLIYAPQASPLQTPYWFFNAPRYRYGLIPDFKPGFPIDYSLRTYHFSGSTDTALAVWDSSGPSCLRILTPDDASSPGFGTDAADLTAISNLEQIELNPATPAVPPAEIFGAEPAHTWCYFYEKADLARQEQAWQQVVDLGEQAFGQGMSPATGFELLPFIEGYARVGHLEMAAEMSRQATALSDNFEPRLCAVWQRLAGETGVEQTRTSMLAELGCGR